MSSTIPFTGGSRTINENSSETGSSRIISRNTSSGTWLDNIMNRPSSSANSYRLEEVVDVDRDMQIFSDRQLNTLSPRTLYNQGRLSLGTLFRHHREEAISLRTGRELRLNLITTEAAEALRRQGRQYVHLGLIVLGIRGLTRQRIGCKGVRFLKPMEFSSEDLAGTEWTIHIRGEESTLAPQNSVMYRNRNGSLSTEIQHMNAGEEASSTSRPQYRVNYPDSTMRTEEGSGIPPRTAVDLYTNNNPLVRSTGKRRPPEVSYFGRDSVLLNITECDPQLYDTYLEQWTASVKRDYAQKHELEQMIRIAENYLGETAKAAWEAFKLKFPEGVTRIASQGNNIFNFCFAIHGLLTARDANT
ncbi:hypothetical protein PanWU01x14_261170 [Parasponia andersonii]|uniref:Uncharacterized protein n=1 Tax=Parasponia andersonii TaxID=3476 RepID=A0A2P5B8Q8_PARAD|nr:hypothetical protein PanWU01x14_261170 [Parasponia andersonii]